MRNLLTHALSPNLVRQVPSTDPSTDRVLRDVFWRGEYDRPIGTVTSLVEARAKKLRQSRR
jgi:hypothetical protein